MTQVLGPRRGLPRGGGLTVKTWITKRQAWMVGVSGTRGRTTVRVSGTKGRKIGGLETMSRFIARWLLTTKGVRMGPRHLGREGGEQDPLQRLGGEGKVGSSGSRAALSVGMPTGSTIMDRG